MTKDQLLIDAMRLSREERAELANRLLATLDFDEDFELSDAWLAEVKKRSAEISDQAVTPVPAETAFAEAYRRIRDVG